MTLADAKQRRLLAFLLSNDVRQPTGLPKAFISGLSTAWEAGDDPALAATVSPPIDSDSTGWRLESIETKGFGGLNSWGGGTFKYQFSGESLLLEGPNGSGKSSLVGAIVWALSGERPRDQANAEADEPRPVLTAKETSAGDWPPIATYPPDVMGLRSPPSVYVKLTFRATDGSRASVERSLQDGNVTSVIDPAFDVPPVLIETGLLMPARFAKIRLDDGRSRLTDAVQKLTGLDDVVAIGKLTEGLCHKSREYRSYRKRELTNACTQFRDAIDKARKALAPVQASMQSFVPEDTNDAQGEMARFGKTLNERAANLTEVITSDLAEGLDLSSPTVQHSVIAAIAKARNGVEGGLEQIRTWKSLQKIAQAFDREALEKLQSALPVAHTRCEEAIRLSKRASSDHKFQLKSLAAKWHSDHVTGPIKNCPLCEQTLAQVPSLAQEMEKLQASGDAASRTYTDNLNAILADLEQATPVALRNLDFEPLKGDIRDTLLSEIREQFVVADDYKRYLVRFAMLVDGALSDAPAARIKFSYVKTNSDAPNGHHRIMARIAILKHLMELAKWLNGHSAAWIAWWESLANHDTQQPPEDDEREALLSEAPKRESLKTHITRLSDALAKAEPYRNAANEMRTVWRVGKTAAEIRKEVSHRDAIANSLEPLKSMGSLCEAVAREAIEDLSGRIANILERIHLTEQLQFQSARLERKNGLVVLGGFTPALRIDATFVANTSWVRAVLWAFLFSLREEAVDQRESDPFPLLVFDDPQSTFDSQHRHMWARYIVSLQNKQSKVQLLLTTYDENFLDLIQVDGIVGRRALIGAPGPNDKHVAIFEGEALDRAWEQAMHARSKDAGVSFIRAVRTYVEGMLKLMLRGQDADIPSLVIGTLRNRLREYHLAQRAPWNQAAFKRLVATLDKGVPEVKYLEGSHHTTGKHYGMGEATSVEEYWRKTLKPALDRACRAAREYQLVHGGSSALHGRPPVANLPEGYQNRVRDIPLRVLGRAAALTDGRVADGIFKMDQIAEEKAIQVTLGRHFAYRLTAATLEPVARAGDILLVKEHGEPSEKSLTLAISEDRLLARRFEIAENHTDIAVLTAQSVNPRQIAPPIIADRSTFKLHKIVGVLYDDSQSYLAARTDAEICECEGESVLRRFSIDTLGLVEVTGQSAEPYALDGQYLIVSNPIPPKLAKKSLQGQPVIAADTSGNTYFKRFRCIADDQIVLESLESSGIHSPVVLSPPGGRGTCLDRVWQVAGVLFEK